MNTRVYLLQGNSGFETPIAVRVLLTRFLLTYIQVSTILSFKGWLLLVQTLLLEKPTPNFLLLSSWYHLYYWCWHRPPWRADTLWVSSSLLLNAHLPWQHFTSAASPLKHFYQQIPSTTKLSLHLHSQRTVTVFTTNLVQDSGCYVQEKHGFVQASVLWVERSLFQHNAHFSYCSILNSFIKLSWVFFLPHFHLLILWLFPLVSAASLCRKKNQTIPSKFSSSRPDSLWLLATNSQNRPHETLF